MDDISQRVKTIVASYLDVPVEVVVEDASFTEDLGADSLEIVEIVMAFEEEFGVEIGDEKIDAISTVGDAIRYLKAAHSSASE